MQLGHCIERTAILEPLDLRFVERVRELSFPHLAILGVHLQRQGLPNSEFGAHHVYPIIRIDLVVIRWVGERQRQHPLLLKICFVL